MKASELRIGNLINGIYHDYDDGIHEDIENETICKVVTLDVSGSGDYPIYVYSDEDIEHFSDFEPIPLTEEWLVKFGFDKTSLHYLKKNGIIIQSEDDYFECLLGIVIVKLQYVHQLQNLYFALAGEELTIKNQE